VVVVFWFVRTVLLFSGLCLFLGWFLVGCCCLGLNVCFSLWASLFACLLFGAKRQNEVMERSRKLGLKEKPLFD